MRTQIFVILIIASSFSPVLAGTLAGANDGLYRAQDGSFISISSADSEVGIQFRSCEKPTVRNGRLTSKKCWANGHDGGGIDVSWQIDGGSIISENKRYAPMAQLPPPPKPDKLDAFEPSAHSWMHNGSEVSVDQKVGLIRYNSPKEGLRGVVESGSVIFEGDLKPGGLLLGTAYAFKKGCLPASYPVRGLYSDHNEVLTFIGPGPKREGCIVVAYTYSSPHSKLVFRYTYGD